uniref:hypothetical protein n=1 Tax=Alistipes sp. TaxID=1872444 RepID=UPI004056565A
MEPVLIQVIGTLLIIALAYVAQERKRRAKEKEVPQTVEPQRPHPLPTAQPKKSTRVAPQAQRQSAYRKIHPDSQESIPYSEVSSNAMHHNAPRHQEESSAAPQEEPKSPILEDFDARKAVVWSEILKPKFDE